MLKATSVQRAGDAATAPFVVVTLRHDERRLRRKLLSLAGGEEVLVDLALTTTLAAGDLLMLEDGRSIEIAAARESLYEIRGRDPAHLAEIAWHLGNRHLPTQIDWRAPGGPRLLIARDHVIAEMINGLGGLITEIVGPFSPLQGAYAHDHGHALLNP